MSQELIVFVTVPDNDLASLISESLVSRELAACVNILPGVDSVYRWEGKITRDHELLLIIKTTEELYEGIEQCVKELHSYTTPEVIALKIERGSADYLKWIQDSTKG